MEGNSAPPAVDMWTTRRREFPTYPQHYNSNTPSIKIWMVDPKNRNLRMGVFAKRISPERRL
jgi:hypothetical protein